MYDISRRIGIKEIVDKHVIKRNQGLSTGTYLNLAAINRAVKPTSKNAFAEWYSDTILRRLIPASGKDLTSQRFWDHMNRISLEDIRSIEADIAAKIVSEFDLSLRRLIYDGTNFHTWISTKSDSELAQRGHNKQKRNDLKQVSLALMVTEDFHIPLFHELYPGNVNDTQEFGSIVEDLVERHKKIAGECENVTLIFDKGNNSADNFEKLDKSSFNFVGSLTPSHHKDLLDVPRKKYCRMKGERLEGIEVYRTKKEVFGESRTILVTWNEELFIGQIEGLAWQLRKKRRELRKIKTRLERRASGRVTAGKKPTIQSIQRQVDKLLSWQYHSKIFEIEIYEKGGHVNLNFQTKTAEIANLQKRQFGKTILFTDNHRWSNAAIISAYRSQYRIENAFKQMKDPVFASWKPRFHWTDQKLRVHAFYCVLSLALTSLLQRELHKEGIDISVNKLLSQLENIQEVAVIYPKSMVSNDHISITLSEMSQEQKQLFDALNLKKYCATI